MHIFKPGSSGGGGSGGGGSLQAYASDSTPAPVDGVVDNFGVLSFSQAAGQSIFYNFVVPSSYVAGAQLNMTFQFFSDAASNNIHWIAKTKLIQLGQDATVQSDQHISATAAITQTNANYLQTVTLDLCSGLGQINSIPVASDDLLLIEIYRDPSDTATEDAYLIKTTVRIE